MYVLRIEMNIVVECVSIWYVNIPVYSSVRILTPICADLQEKVLEIEYIKAVIPRKEEEPSLHDDWVSAVDGSNPG